MTQYLITKLDPVPRQQGDDWHFDPDGVYPATVPFADKPGGLKQSSVRLTKEWLEFYLALNDPADWEACLRPGNFWMLSGQEPFDPHGDWDSQELPKVECLTTACNVLEIEEIDGEWRKVVSCTTNPLPWLVTPDKLAQKYNYKTSSYIISSFTSIRPRDRHVGLLFGKHYCYFPVISNDEAWLHRDDVHMFPPAGKYNVIWDVLNVRSQPSADSELLHQYRKGEKVEIYDFFPTMGNVFGLTNKGYVALRWQPAAGWSGVYHSTTWQIPETAPCAPNRTFPGELPTFDGSVPEPPPPPVTKLTNQDVIDLFYKKYGRETYWTIIAGLGMQWLVNDRRAPYTGPMQFDLHIDLEE